MEKNTEMKNLFQLDGRVPVLKAIPFDLPQTSHFVTKKQFDLD